MVTMALRSRSSGSVVMRRRFYVIFFLLILIGLIITGALQFWPHNIETDKRDMMGPATPSRDGVLISSSHAVPRTGDQSCLFHTCFDVYNCGYNDETKISVYVYPDMRYVNDKGEPIGYYPSEEFKEIIQTVEESIYYTPDPDHACLFVPQVDTLNQNSLQLTDTGRILASLPYWKDGTNHILFNMLPGSIPDFNTTLDVPRGKAVLAGGGFSTITYRRGFDVALPVFNPLTSKLNFEGSPDACDRQWLLVSAQPSLHPVFREALVQVADQSARFLLLDNCDDKEYYHRCDSQGREYNYPHILQNATFCLIVRGARLGQTGLSDAFQAGCIPVIVADGYVLPFSEVLDWRKASVQVREAELQHVMQVVQSYSEEKVKELQTHVRFFWESYFSSMRQITLTLLHIINDRVFPYAARKYEEWNNPPSRRWYQSPLFLPLIPPRSHGFTAVILTYDRLDTLFRVITQVAQAPSLAKVLVVWNNQIKPPPPAPKWPSISKPLKVVQTPYNRLSNRFYPYNEIETEAIFSIDDDIVMLTTEEIEFAYEVWREFSDRLVGFPSRLHLWDNSTAKWKYESEWTSEISVVLTGAAFYHKYYSFLYTNSMPGNIKSWVDQHMNCEDIAMNFLIANMTGLPPIKVTPKKKFKCPECTNMDMLSADLSHMVERSECINKFAEVYGSMPLKTVEFRADPVLYKDNVPPHLMRYKDIGSL